MSGMWNAFRLCLGGAGVVWALLLASAGAQAMQFKVFYNFRGLAQRGRYDGDTPTGTLVADKAGNLYGATFSGGQYLLGGVVFKITPDGTESVLASINAGERGPLDGVVLDNIGNLYGASWQQALLFQIAPDGTETDSYDIAQSAAERLLVDKAGNVYGTSETGGAGCQRNGGQGCGTVFSVSPQGVVTTLYAFKGGPDGQAPFAGVIMDRSGNLYGTTTGGGLFGGGTVFRLAPNGTKSLLHSFGGGSDGAGPYAELIRDEAGNLYGTTFSGGGTGCSGYGCGTVFRLAPDGEETVLHAFAGGSDGSNPTFGLARDMAGNLYGTTNGLTLGQCGNAPNCGTAFQVAPDGTETVLYTFPTSGGPPNGGLYIDKAGNLFGAMGGWKNNLGPNTNSLDHGAIYELTK